MSDTFPPASNTTLQKVIASYLYWQYSDDASLQTFVDAYNALSQDYLDTFNDLNLPIYTQDPVSGALLDWVAEGLYGMTRPALPNTNLVVIGPYNTYRFNTLAFNARKIVSPDGGAPVYIQTSDDTFRRVITWHFYKGDGKVFNIQWLKRRVMRFVYPGFVTNTYPVSVTFGADNQVNISFLSVVRNVTGGAIFGRFGFNSTRFNQIDTQFVSSNPVPPEALVLKAAIDGGALELPFQFTYVVEV